MQIQTVYYIMFFIYTRIISLFNQNERQTPLTGSLVCMLYDIYRSLTAKKAEVTAGGIKMDSTTRDTINTFLSKYDTLIIATESEGQPYATSTFYAEEVLQDSKDANLTLYATFITSSRKLANLRQNPQVGLFIGPQQPSNWLEAIAHVHIIEDEQKSASIRQRLAEKSPVAAMFLAQVPTAAIEMHIQWLRITNLTATPLYTEATFPVVHTPEDTNK